MLPILRDITIAATGVPQQLPNVPFQVEVDIYTNELTGNDLEISANSDFTEETVLVSFQYPFVYAVGEGGNLDKLWVQGTAGDTLSVVGV